SGAGGGAMTRPFEVLRPFDLRAHTALKWQLHGPDVLPLWVAEMDVLPAPEVVAALTEAIRTGDTGYPASGRPYARAFAEFAASRWNWAPDSDHTLQCADVMTGIRLLLARLTEPGGPVLIPTPVYPPFAGTVRELGRRVVPVALTEQGRLDVPAIGAALAALASDTGARPGPGAPVLLLCSPHNPTGVVHTGDELAAVAALAARFGAQVVIDEVHGPLVPAPGEFVAWLSVADTGFVVTSAAKAFNLAGLKAGLIVAAPRAAPVLATLPDSTPYGASHLGVVGHAAAYGSDPRWLDAVNANIALNVDRLGALLAERIPAIGYQRPAATYLAWLDCRALDLGEDPARAFLERGRVALTSGVAFGPGGQGFARLNLACSDEVLTEAVDRMAVAVAAHAESKDGAGG
ncbi:MAG: aminotransferase class I/II-fold pyridoxal phosphate-dependent enzyme, partial [Candidatus Nanopelagicales bacterium]